MSETDRMARAGGRKPHLLAQQNVAGGIALVLLAMFALWITGDLQPGTLGSMGSGMLPRMLACALGLCGLALVISALAKSGDRLEGLKLRGPALIILAIITFAVTIRSVPLGIFDSPELGLVVAAPLAILISGYASPEARFRELFLLASGLTPLCMLLFGDLLNLSIPLFPRTLGDWFPDHWSQKAILRMVALTMLAVCAVVLAVGWGRPDSADGGGQ